MRDFGVIAVFRKNFSGFAATPDGRAIFRITIFLREGSRRMISVFDAVSALRSSDQEILMEVLDQIVCYRFPVVTLIRRQRELCNVDRSLRSTEKLLEQAKEWVGKEDPDWLLADDKLAINPGELLVHLATGVEPLVEVLVQEALRRYARAGRISEIQSDALGYAAWVRSEIDGLSLIMNEDDASSHSIGNAERTLNLIKVLRALVMSHYFKDENDLDLWDVLFAVEHLGDEGLSLHGFSRAAIVEKLNAGLLRNEDDPWTTARVKDVTGRFYRTIAPRLAEKLNTYIAASAAE
jgi:hypothetical protein